MIRLGLRLALGSGREAALRVLVTAAAVALGVGLLLIAFAGVNGPHAQTDRGAWLDTAAQKLPPSSTSSRAGRLWRLSSTDEFDDQAIDRVDVAATRPNAPVPPGITHLPGPGEYHASPALAALLRSQPANELRDRYPGRQIGTIGAARLPSQNSLIIVVGHTPRQLSQAPGAIEVAAIQRTPANCYACESTGGGGPVLQFILAGGAVALLLPVLILIATASRLSAARREERFAAMRLVGATLQQISVGTEGGSSGYGTLADTFCSFSTSTCPSSAEVPSISEQVLTKLAATPGVRAMTVIHERAPQAPLARKFVRSRLLRRAGWNASYRQVRSRRNHGEHRLFPLERPRAQLARLDDDLAVGAPVRGGRHASPRRRCCRRDGWVGEFHRTGTDCARTGLCLPGNAGDRRNA